MREGLSAGKHVVRLKIGDPFIFGRGGEEVLEMRTLGVEPKVVPGISSVFSAPLLGGVPVTHRGVATQVGVGDVNVLVFVFCRYLICFARCHDATNATVATDTLNGRSYSYS